MEGIKRKLILSVFVLMSLCILAGNGLAAVNLPNATFGGVVQTTEGVGSGSLQFTTVIIQSVFYLDSLGTPTSSNIPGVETIIGMSMTLTDAIRTGDYTFSDATLTIGDGAHTYFTATLSNIVFVNIGTVESPVWALNPDLDSNNPSTLNLSNMSFNTVAGNESQFIDELEQTLMDASVANSGVKMRLNFVYPDPDSITGFGIATISEGVLDGAPDAPSNIGPLAEAGVVGGSNVVCAASSCEITLDGSGSSDPDDGIEFYNWYDENGTLLGSGETLLWTLPLGIHNISLEVIDFSGEIATDTITIVVDPAELSFIQIDKAHVKKDGKVKIRGRLSLPAGVSHLDINSVGHAVIGISDLTGNPVIDESVDFTESNDGNKWKYNVSPTLGIKKFRIDWTGSKYNYQDGGLTITTDHIGDNETELVITSCLPYSITVGGVTITRDYNGAVTASDPTVKVDGDDDGDSDDSDSDGGYCPEDDDCIAGVRLPFALTPDMSIDVNGILSSIGDGYTAAVGKFKIHGRFDATGIDFSLLVPILDLTVTLGTEEFYGRLVISDDPVPTWTKIKPKYWKYRAH